MYTDFYIFCKKYFLTSFNNKKILFRKEKIWKFVHELLKLTNNEPVKRKRRYIAYYATALRKGNYRSDMISAILNLKFPNSWNLS